MIMSEIRKIKIYSFFEKNMQNNGVLKNYFAIRNLRKKMRN